MGSGVLTADQAIEVIRRNTSPEWFNGHKSDPTGTAVLNGIAAVGEKVSRALTRQTESVHISTASAGAPGTCSLVVTRQTSTASAVVPKGYSFRTSLGVVLAVVSDVTVHPSQAEISLPLITLRRIDLLNTTFDAFYDLVGVGDLLDPCISPDSGGVLDSEGHLFLGVDGWVDASGVAHAAGGYTARYGSSTPIDGASGDWLSVLGEERGQIRQDGEDGEAYRIRVRNIPDAVSPKAIAQAARGVASHAGLATIHALETINPEISTELAQALGLGFSDSVYFDGDYFDDPVGADLDVKAPFRSLEMVSVREGRSYFRIVLDGKLCEPDLTVAYFDDAFFDDQVWGYPDVGMHPKISASLKALLDEINRKRAAAVMCDFYVSPGVVIPSAGAVVGNGTGATPIVAWSEVAEDGWSWRISDGLISCIANHTWDPDAYGFQVAFTFSDGTVVETEVFTSNASVRFTTDMLTKLGVFNRNVVQIDGRVIGDGIASLSLVGTFWAIPFALQETP